jgi:hypothetical protein
MAQTKKRSLVDEVLDDALQVRETALANAKLALEEAFEPRIKSMISRHLQTEMEQEDEMEEEYGDDEEMEEEYGDEEMEEEYEDPTNADDATLGEEEEEEEMTSEEEEEEEEMTSEEEEEDLDLESVIAELEAELGDEEESEEDEMEMDLEDEMEMDSEEEDEEIIDLEELLSALSEEEDEEEVTEEEDEEEAELAQENKRLASELAEHREALTILRSKLNEVNLLNAKLLYTTKLFRKYNLSNNQKMKVVESFDRTKSVRETKLVYSTLAESLSIGAKSNTSVRKISITEGFASKPTKSTKPKTNIINESNDVADRFRRLVNYNK